MIHASPSCQTCGASPCDAPPATSRGAVPPAKDPEKLLWMPPKRLRRYQWQKVFAGALVSAIFLGWLVIQWSSLFVRTVSLLLLGVTAWVVARSIADDAARSRGRQIALIPGSTPALEIVTPDAVAHLSLRDIHQAEWRDEPVEQAGLWLFDQQHHALGHLDPGFFTDQLEACAFLRWARRQVHMDFPVRWPQPVDV